MLRILLSQESARVLDAPIREHMAGNAYRLCTVDPSAPPPTDIDLAFLSRDIAGSSAKHALSPGLLWFYAALRGSPCLKWLQLYSAGADRPFYKEMRDRSVSVTSATGTASSEVAHSAVAGMLALNRKLPVLFKAQTRREWCSLHHLGLPAALKGQRALVVGLGPIGRRIARILATFDIDVVGVRHSDAAVPECVRTITYGAIDAELPDTDWVFLACPLTDATRRLLNRTRLAGLKPGACVVNVARGEVIDEAALIQGLRSGHIGGAFLDVFETEPLSPESPLWSLENVIVTPHCASHSEDNAAQVRALFLENLARWRNDQPLLNPTA